MANLEEPMRLREAWLSALTPTLTEVEAAGLYLAAPEEWLELPEGEALPLWRVKLPQEALLDEATLQKTVAFMEAARSEALAALGEDARRHRFPVLERHGVGEAPTSFTSTRGSNSGGATRPWAAARWPWPTTVTSSRRFGRLRACTGMSKASGPGTY